MRGGYLVVVLIRCVDGIPPSPWTPLLEPRYPSGLDISRKRLPMRFSNIGKGVGVENCMRGGDMEDDYNLARDTFTSAVAPLSGIRIHGERNSGTNYLEILCKQNTCSYCESSSKHSMSYTFPFSPREKPWSKYRDPTHDFRGDVVVRRAASPPRIKYMDLVIVRNVIDWLVSMWRYPIHCGYHCDLGTFMEFISTTWGEPPNGRKSWNFTIQRKPRCGGTALYLKPPPGKNQSRDILEHRTRWLMSFHDAAYRDRAISFVRHEDLTDAQGLGFESLFRHLARDGFVLLRPGFPKAVNHNTGRSKFINATSKTTSAYEMLSAGTWPTFGNESFKLRGRMTDVLPLEPVLDQKVVDYIRSGVNASLEAELGYNYSFPIFLDRGEPS